MSDRVTAPAPEGRPPRGHIEHGIEWFAINGDENNLDGMCARCGSSVEWVDCWDCGGEGVTGHDCGEDSCCCRYPDDNVVCSTCRGVGGSWHCISTPDYCNAHPLPARDGIRSTALNTEAWADAL